MKRNALLTFTALLLAPLVMAAQEPPPNQTIQMSYCDTNPFRDALRAVPKDAVFKMDGYYLWDPSVIKVGDTYHLFVSRWPEATGEHGWFNSDVIRCTAKSLFGPYQIAEVVLKPGQHAWDKMGVCNCKVIRVGNRFLLYYLAIPAWQTAFSFADKIEGPWIAVDKPVIPINNPAVLIRPDGKAYAVGKFKVKTTKEVEWNDYMRAFEAETVTGPYRVLKDDGNRLPHGFQLEDPAIWWANNQYHVLCTDWRGLVTGVNKAVVAYTSKDGIAYKLYSNVPIWSQNDPIPIQGGASLRVRRVERPDVFLDENAAVEAIVAAVQPSTGASFIVIRPVKNFTPENGQRPK